MKSLEEAIIEYQNEADKFVIEAEENNNFELLTVSNSLKRAKACIEEKKQAFCDN